MIHGEDLVFFGGLVGVHVVVLFVRCSFSVKGGLGRSQRGRIEGGVVEKWVMELVVTQDQYQAV